MGRKHYTERIPQQTRHAKERGRWDIGEAPRPQPIGVRRRLDRATGFAFLGALCELDAIGGLPEQLKPRRSSHVTLLPHRAYESQLKQGKLSQQKLLDARAQIDRKSRNYRERQVQSNVVDVAFLGGRILILKLESEQLQTEREDIANVMERFGVKGLDGQYTNTTLHVSVAEADRPLPLDVRRRALKIVGDALDTVHPLEEPLTFDAWSVYPQPETARLLAA